MNHLSLILLLFFGSINGSLSSTINKAKEFQSGILQMRVKEFLNYRQEGLTQCKYKDPWIEEEIRIYNQDNFDNNQEKLESSLQILIATETLNECHQEINNADEKLHQLQRRKFNFPTKIIKSLCAFNKRCLARANQLIQELDPFCVTQNSKNLFGVKDPNPCMAGDRLLAKQLRQKNDPYQEDLYIFLTTLQAEIEAANEGSQIDFWNIYLKNRTDSLVNRKKFIAIMTFFYYAMGTAGGYIDGVSDHYWMSAFKELQSPEEIFNEFYSMKQKVDWYGHIVNRIAKKKKIGFFIKQVPTHGMNRHDFMAMFLSCHFRDYGLFAPKMIPRTLGSVYESLDFVSHIKEKISFQDSIKNFKRDVSRYINGSSLGDKFCSYKP